MYAFLGACQAEKKHSLGHDIMKTPFERHVGTIGMSNAKDPDGKQPKKRAAIGRLASLQLSDVSVDLYFLHRATC